MKTRTFRLLGALALLIALTILAPTALAASASASSNTTDTATVLAAPYSACTYVVQPGDNLYRISLRYGVSYYTLAAMNGLSNFNYIYAGMVLRVPCGNQPPYPPPQPIPGGTVCNVHFVQRGEWLTTVAARYGVSWQSIAALNGLRNPNLIYAGQRLLIPCRSGMPIPPITLTSFNGQVCGAVTFSGKVAAAPFEGTLRVRIYNAQGVMVGQGTVQVNAEMGKPGTFNGAISFDKSKVRNGSTGRVEVAAISPRDGSVINSASVYIRFPCGY